MRNLRYFGLALAVILIAAYAGVTSMPYGTGQNLAHGDVVAQVGAGQFIWNSNPGWASTDGQGTTYSEFTTYVKNGGCSAPTGNNNQLIDKAHADACKVLTSVHTPILANNTFSGGSIANWTSVCGAGLVATDQDGDNGMEDSGVTSGQGCTESLKQTFTISGTPTAQSGSLYFEKATTPGGSFCQVSTSAVSNVTIKVNGTTVYGPANPTTTWTQATFTPTLVNGTNTFEVDATLQSGDGYTTSLCNTEHLGTADLYVDNVVLQATY